MSCLALTIFSSTNSTQSDSWYPDTEERIKNKTARPSFKKSDVDEKLVIKTGNGERENEKWEQNRKWDGMNEN